MRGRAPQPDGSTSVLKLVDEDERSIGAITWKGLEFLNEDDMWREETLEPARRASRSRVTVKMHSKVAKVESSRVANEMGGLEGDTVRSAWANTEAKRNSGRGAAQADAYGIRPGGIDVPETASASGLYVVVLKLNG